MALTIEKRCSTTNTTYCKGRPIKYIVIHYTAGCKSTPGTARGTVDWFNNPSAQASADFTVDQGIIVQKNPDIKNRYCWAVGGAKQNTKGGSLYNKAYNKNVISIEMCSTNTAGKITYGNDPRYSIDPKVVDLTVKLTQYLMKTYNVDINHVIRHYDVTGKLCPGVIGWNENSGSTKAWKDFLTRLKAGWKKNDTGWWYSNGDGTWPSSCWKKINGAWFYFNEKGYALQDEWFQDKGEWYYLDPDCYMVTGWHQEGTDWFWFRPKKADGHPEGSMLTGWVKDKYWYYLDPEADGTKKQGAMHRGWLEVDGKKYYLRPKRENGYPDGSMVTGKYTIDGKTYTFTKSGDLVE